MNDYAKMYETTTSKVQKKKVIMHGLKWINDKVVEVQMNIIINEEK